MFILESRRSNFYFFIYFYSPSLYSILCTFLCFLILTLLTFIDEFKWIFLVSFHLVDVWYNVKGWSSVENKNILNLIKVISRECWRTWLFCYRFWKSDRSNKIWQLILKVETRIFILRIKGIVTTWFNQSDIFVA